MVKGPLSGVMVVDSVAHLGRALLHAADGRARRQGYEGRAAGERATTRASTAPSSTASRPISCRSTAASSRSRSTSRTGREAHFRRLLAKADVVVENFRPGTMEKLGYGWETLHVKYPNLIYAAASGFGHSGPYSQSRLRHGRAGDGRHHEHDRPPGQPPPGRDVDRRIGAGLYAAVAVNAALIHREDRRVDQG